MEDTSPVHLDLDSWLAGINLDEGRLCFMEKPDKIESGLG